MRIASGVLLMLGLLAGCGDTSVPDAGGDAAPAMDAGRDAGPSFCTDDAECDDGLFCNGAETCGADARCAAGTPPDCDDGIACTADRCSEELRECVAEPPDADGDGVADAACLGTDGLPLGTDCDDADANRFPGNLEVCDDDDRDEDCDDSTFGSRDLDRDGFVDAACCNASATGGAPTCGDDCDDLTRSTNPGDSEQCNAVDDDCDGTVDEAIVFVPYYPDCDGDNFGDMNATPVTACIRPAMDPPCSTSRAGWIRDDGSDCDDAVSSVNPAAAERCNEVDDDCDMQTDEELTIADWYPDCDRDGWGDREATPVPGCAPPTELPVCAATGEWAPRGGDCAEGNPARSPASAELCNNVDDDCDGLVDDVVGDEVFCTFGEVAPCTSRCGEPGTHTCDNSCRSFGLCSSEGIEVCNYCDDNLDGLADEVPMAFGSNRIYPLCTPTAFGDQVPCVDDPDPTEPRQTVVLLDGTQEEQAGAMWLNLAGRDLPMGYGSMTLRVEMQVRGVPSAGTSPIQSPLGGWAVVIARGGDPVLGPARDYGVPSGRDMDGVAAQWHWNNGVGCMGGSFPPSASDSISYRSLDGGRRRRVGASTSDWSCFPGGGITNGVDTEPLFNGQTDPVSQGLTIHYTPDNPRTFGVNEERMEILVDRPSLGPQSFVYTPENSPGVDNDIPIGSPLRIGLMAATYTETFVPPGMRFGMPVEVTATVWNAAPFDATDNDLVRLEVQGLCPQDSLLDPPPGEDGGPG